MKMNSLRGGARLPHFVLLCAANGDGDGGGGGGSPPAPPPPASPPAPSPANEPFYAKDVVDADDRAWMERGGYKDYGAVVKSARHGEQLLGVPKEQLLKLPADRSPANMGDVFSALGKPENLEGYSALIKEDASRGLVGPMMQGFAEVSNNLHLLPWQVEGLLKFYGDGFTAEGAAQIQATEALYGSADKALRDEWGAAYDQNLSAIDALAEQHGGAELVKFLHGEIGEDPQSQANASLQLVKMLHKVSGLLSEGGMPGDSGLTPAIGGKMSPAQARTALTDFERANNDAMMNVSHPDHKEVVRRREELIKLAHPAPAKDAG